MYVKTSKYAVFWHVIAERNRTLKVKTSCGQTVSLGKGVETYITPTPMCRDCIIAFGPEWNDIHNGEVETD